MTANSLARQLKNFKVYPRSIRISTETPKGYRRRDFEDAWSRYCPQTLSHVEELELKLWRVIGDEPHGSRKLAQLAGVEYSETIIPILKNLRRAGKVELIEGRWARVTGIRR